MGDSPTPGSDLPSGMVTFLFTDIEGSTRMAHCLADSYRTVLHDHRDLLRQVFERHTGAELLTEGDSFFVAFSRADAAVAAALEAQQALAAHPWPTDPRWRGPARPRVRMGLHTAPAKPDDQGYATAEVHRAARVCGAAHGDQVLCTADTLDAAGAGDYGHTDLGLHRLRGFDRSERLYQLCRAGLPHDFPAPLAHRRHHNLPADEDDFIGRDAELTDLRRLLPTHRIISVTALPRTGKTRLVRRLAHDMADRYHDGVWYTTLRPDSGGLAQALAGSLGLRDDPFRDWMATVLEALHTKQCLLIFDQARPGDAAAINRIVTGCPRVTVLSVALRPLGVVGEVKWAMPTMSATDAAALLRRRACQGSGGVDPGDCMDLAIEVDGFPPTVDILARAVSVFGRTEVRRRLRDDPMAILDARGELTEVLADTYRGLSPRAAQLLRAMAALPGPVGVDQAERLCGGSAAALNALIDLVDRSLVDVQRTGSSALYRVPRPVQLYVEHQRELSGEAPMMVGTQPRRYPVTPLSWEKSMI